MTEKSSSFEIEAGTMERFLELLKSREDERVPAEEETLIRRAVFVAPLTQLRTEAGGIPVSIRRVRAAFAYGGDQVTLSRHVYDGFELPPPSREGDEHESRQDEALQKIRHQIEEGVRERGLTVPVVVAWMKPPAAPGDRS